VIPVASRRVPSVSVRPVEGKRDLDRFIKLPFRLRRDDPVWVPPLVLERRRFLDHRRNPYFQHADAQYFLCERDGEVVGRISAQVDLRWDEFQGGSDGMFGFFEAEEDPEVAGALVEAAAGWVAERGRSRVLGPMDFTTNDESGLLIEGFERHPMILQPWHPPHYQRLLEGAGLRKKVDLLTWELGLGSLKQGDRFHDFIHQAAERARIEHGITVRAMRKRDLAGEVSRFTAIYNEAWGDNWGFVPVTEEEARHMAGVLRPVLSEDWAMVAEKDGEAIGAALTLPDVNQVLAGMNGRLLPFGWLRFAAASLARRPWRQTVDRVRVFALGVKPKWQHTGAAAAMYVRHLETASRVRQKGGEMGWILETNEPMNRAMEGMGGEIVKRHRLFELALGG
jgi:hypothetical protein